MQLLTAAIHGELHRSPHSCRRRCAACWPTQARNRCRTDFGFQWLNLGQDWTRSRPDARLFRNATGTLDVRPLLKREMELFLDSVLRSDQPVTALLTADYTYLNETLAMLYGIDYGEGRPVPPRDPCRIRSATACSARARC